MKPEEMTIGEKKQLKLMKKVEAAVAKVLRAFSRRGHFEVYSAMHDLERLLEANKLDPHCSDERDRVFHFARITGQLEPAKLKALLKQRGERPLTKDDVPLLARTLKKSIKAVMLEYGFANPAKY